MAQRDSREIDAFSVCYNDMINAIRDPEAVARHLCSRGVVPEEAVSAVRLVPGADTLLNSNKLMMLVRFAIQTDRSKFPLLVTTLKELPELAGPGWKLEGASGSPSHTSSGTGPLVDSVGEPTAASASVAASSEPSICSQTAEAFRSLLPELVKAVDSPGGLATELYASKLIALDMANDICTSSLSKNDKSRTLMMSLQARLEGNPSDFEAIMKVFENSSALSPGTADELRQLHDALKTPVHTDDVAVEGNVSTQHSPENGTGSEDLTIVHARLEKKDLVSEFGYIAIEIQEELETTKTVSDFRNTFLLRLIPSRKAAHLRYFEQYLGELVKQTTYDGLFGYLNFYWDYLNYSLLETIVKEFGSREIKRRMGKFCKDVKRFRGSTTLRVFKELEHDEEHPPPPNGFQTWKSKFNITLDSTLEDVNQVRIRVAREFQLHEFALNIAYLEFSSVFVIWLLPQSVVDILKCGLSAQLLDELHIESITPCPQDAEDMETPTEEGSEGLEVQAIGVSAQTVTSPAQQKLDQQLLTASKNVLRDDVKRVQALLEQGADPHSTDDRHGRTLLMWASFRNNPKTVEALLHHSASSHINAQDSKGWGAFTLACEKEYINIATSLLREGANIDLQNAAGWSALMRAAYTGKQNMAQFLLEKGANTEMKDKEGWTALMAASQRGHKKVAQMLLEFKADPNAGTERGMTALMSASQENHLDIVRLLKKHGAIVNMKRTDGVTALHIACDSNNTKIVDELYQTEGIELDAKDEVRAQHLESGAQLAPTLPQSYFQPSRLDQSGKIRPFDQVSGEPLQQRGYTGPAPPRLRQSYFQPSRLDQSGKIRPFGQRPSSGDIISFKWINKGEEKTFKVRKTFACKWRDLGKKFGFSKGKLNTFAANNRDDPEKCFDDVISLWKSDGSVPPAAYRVTWRGLITALQEVGGVHRKVETLVTALEHKVENTDCMCVDSQRLQSVTYLPPARHTLSSQPTPAAYMPAGPHLHHSPGIYGYPTHDIYAPGVMPESQYFTASPSFTHGYPSLTWQHYVNMPHMLRPPHQSPAESGEQPPPSKRAKVDPLSEDMQTYASYLKEVYTKHSTISYDKWPHVTSRKFINLLMIGKECSDKQEAERLKIATIHGNIDDINKSKAPLNMDEVACNLEDGSLPKCILVEGAPGVGKSMFAWELCGKWGRGEMLQQYKLVVLLRLREKKVRKAKTVEDLFRYHNKRVRQAVVEEIEQTGGKGVLLLLEGYDELPMKERSEDSFFMSVIKGDELPEATVLVTSRHSASDTLHTSHQCKRKISQHVEIIGFTKDNINAYLEASSNRDSEFLTGIHKYLECYPHIHSMMYIPLNCAIVVEVYRNCRRDGTLVPKTMTELCLSLICSLLLRYLNEHPEYSKQKWNIQSFSDLPQKVFAQFCEVARIAYDGFFNGQQVIFSDLPDDFESLGLMQCVPELYVDQGAVLSYNFLHLIVQEFLTAFHMSRLPVAEQVKAFSELKDSATHNVVLRFLAGLTKFADVSSENLQSVLSPELGSLSLEALHWIFETQDDISRLLDIAAHDNCLAINHVDLGPFDAYVLGYCTSHSNCVWKYDYLEFSDQDAVDMLAHGAGQQGPGCSGGVSTLVFERGHNHLLPQFPRCITEHLVRVSLLEFQIDDGFTTLSNSTSLTKVNLFRCDVSAAGWKALFQHPTLKELYIVVSYCTIETQHLQGNSSLKTLDFSNCVLSAAEWHGLAIALQDNATLERLIIQNEQDFLENMLKHLDSELCGGTPAGVSSLAAALCHNHTLETLDLRGNIIRSYEPLGSPNSSKESHDGSGDSPAAPQEQGHCISEAVTSLNKMLSQNTSLKHLDLSKFHISPHEAQHLASGMGQNQTIEYLDLSHNAVGDEGATALASMLKNNKTLKKLVLRSTSIGVSDALNLIDSLTHNTTLEKLVLRKQDVPEAQILSSDWKETYQRVKHRITLD